MATKLKPCPFRGDGPHVSRDFRTIDGDLEWEGFPVTHACDRVGRMGTRRFETGAGAVEAWNRRAGGRDGVRRDRW